MSIQSLETMTTTLSWKSISYEQIGEGVPIVFLHGIPLDRRALKNPMEDSLKNINGYKRIYLDLPGMGQSGKINRVYSSDDMVEILNEFITDVIGDAKFLLVGQSYGAYLSLGLLLKNVNSINGVFLICPCTVPDRSKRILPVKKELDWSNPFINKYKKEETFVDYLNFTEVRNEQTWKKYQEDIIPGMKIADLEFINQLQATGYEYTYHNELKNLKFRKPSTILTGSQDACVGFEDAFKLTPNFEHLTFSVLDNTGHNLQIEHPELLKVYFKDWISRVEKN
ncbi:alpha/beta hydrolase [Apibacter raozihei]|uniref:alpha/beta fold hydrolase n=1 Tax=Apibacter TaxID=1778601 RepID=UPI000FE362F7|nr:MULTISPECIES: alpha/beta hydrolase [Apibacter]